MYTDFENIKNYYVYQYHHLDYLDAIINPLKGMIASKEYKEKVILTIEEVKKLFKKNGWEGDGKIGIIWIPPFVDVGVQEDTWGSYLWHVKQSNNGTSFIASPYSLNIKRLLAQNDDSILTHYRKMEPINIMQTISDRFLDNLSKSRLTFEKEFNKLEKDSDELFKTILKKLIGYTQCDLIAQLDDYLKGCYLEILLEVLQNGNKGRIKLRKSSVKIDLSKHNFNDEVYEENLDEEGASWMSLNMFIGDIWHSYEFEPFEEKFDKMIKSVDYKIDTLLKEFLSKHVIIRNCIVHHDWQLVAPSLKLLGKKSIEIATDKNPIEITEWKMIQLTKQEMDLLFSNLEKFVTSFNSFVDKRVITRHYRDKKIKA